MLSSYNKIAIVGRPNVGKSTLFNILTNTRKAIIKNQPGVTRDLQFGVCIWRGKEFEVIDTGGVIESQELMPKLIREKVNDALGLCDAILMVVDARAGFIGEDKTLFKMVQKAGKPFKILVNKIDKESDIEILQSDFFQLSDQLIPCAFEKRQGVSEALDWVFENLKELPSEAVPTEMTIAILGKPNVGKSSLVNHLIGQNRMIVSPIAGTTVDAIDTPFERNGRTYTIIDTAGLRKKAKRIDDVEILAAFKSQDSIAKANIILLMVDAQEGPTDQDAKILQIVQEHHKTVILVANKIDAAEENIERFREKMRAKVKETFHFSEDIPLVYISAKTGAGIKNLFEKMNSLWEKVNIRITTGELNRFFTKVIRKAPAPVYRTVDIKFYYLTQTNQTPPSFIAFANHPEAVDNAYRRFLMKQIKAEWDLAGIPIRIFAMKGSHAE